MKVRINLPPEVAGNKDREHKFIDDVMIWDMETGMDIDFYSIWDAPDSSWRKHNRERLLVYV